MDAINPSTCIKSNIWTLWSENELYLEKVLPRNEIVFARISEVLSAADAPKELVVVYGGGHMPMIEDYILGLGFEAQPELSKWVVAIQP